MNSSLPCSKVDGYDFPFQFMLDMRGSSMSLDGAPKGESMSILAPFQWPPYNSTNHPQKFAGGFAGFYNGPNMSQDDHSFSFFDQSVFFMDEYAQPPSPIPPHPPIPRDSRHRVSFSYLLTKCHRQRMATIAEYPVNEDDSSTEEEDNNHEAVSAIATQTQWNIRAQQSQKSSFQKLLDYVVPYATRRVKGRLTIQNKRKSSFAIVLPQGSSIKTIDSSSTRVSDSSSLDDKNGWRTASRIVRRKPVA